MDHKGEQGSQAPAGERGERSYAEIDTSKDQERIDLASDWAQAAHDIAETTQEPRALHLVDRYLTDSAVGHETPNGVRKVAGSSDNPPRVVLAPVLSVDEEVNARTRRALAGGGGQAASYHEGSPGLLSLNGRDAVTPSWKGILLLHELAHAEAYDTQKRRGEDYKDVGWWDEEVEVFEFEHELMAKVGGEAYEAYINEQLEQFLAKYDDSNIATTGTPIPKLTEEDRIEDIFGASLSDREMKIRKTAVWFDVVYRMFDRKYGEDSQRHKRGFTKLIYDSNIKD